MWGDQPTKGPGYGEVGEDLFASQRTEDIFNPQADCRCKFSKWEAMPKS